MVRLPSIWKSRILLCRAMRNSGMKLRVRLYIEIPIGPMRPYNCAQELSP